MLFSFAPSLKRVHPHRFNRFLDEILRRVEVDGYGRKILDQFGPLCASEGSRYRARGEGTEGGRDAVSTRPDSFARLSFLSSFPSRPGNLILDSPNSTRRVTEVVLPSPFGSSRPFLPSFDGLSSLPSSLSLPSSHSLFRTPS